MRFKTKYSKKIFPFSPGIPWTIKNNKFIVPTIDTNIWNRVLNDKNLIVTCYGGLLESFFSLSYCEALKNNDPASQIFWMGDEKFLHLHKLQSLSFKSKYDLNTEILNKYPVPIFLDKNNNVYFNVLNDYIISKSIFSNETFETNKQILLKQIYKNCLLEWQNFVPKIRNNISEKYENWKKQNKFYDNKKFILIFPKHFHSLHNFDCLNWNDRQIKEFSIIVKQLGISVIVCDENPHIFQSNTPIIKAPLDLEIIINLMQKSWGVLSHDLDFLFVSMMLSEKTIVMSRELSGIYNLYDNAEFIDAKNVIFSDNELNPADLFKFIENNL